jgi:hypothetical protein
MRLGPGFEGLRSRETRAKTAINAATLSSAGFIVRSAQRFTAR